MSDVSSIVSLTIVLAILTEALVEYASTICKCFIAGQIKTAIKQAASVAIAVILCCSLQLDVFAALGMKFGAPLIGIMLTGIFASRGANYFSDFLSRITAAKDRKQPDK